MSARRRVSIALARRRRGPRSAARRRNRADRQLRAARPFTPGAFSDSATIDNGFLPLAPGSQLVMEGRANRGGGVLPHRVVFTVTDLTKVIGGVRSRVVWDLDVNEGVVVESELAFWAQDDAGNVWNTGEYPEEYEAGTFVGAPSVWLAGLDGAEPGIHMPATPAVSKTTRYLQGSAPAVDFLDCAKVTHLATRTCAPVGCFEGALRTAETSPLDPQGGSQIKFYAPGVGVVRVEAVNDPEGETLLLVRAQRARAPGAGRRARRGAAARPPRLRGERALPQHLPGGAAARAATATAARAAGRRCRRSWSRRSGARRPRGSRPRPRARPSGARCAACAAGRSRA